MFGINKFSKFISLIAFYISIILIYVVVQDIYVQTCTFRGAGIIGMFVSLPTCNHLIYILDFINKYLIQMCLGATAIFYTLLA